MVVEQSQPSCRLLIVCTDQNPSSFSLRFPSSAVRRGQAAELASAFNYGKEANDARVRAQTRWTLFQMAYEPSFCFDTVPSSLREASGNVRRSLFCLKGTAKNLKYCSLVQVGNKVRGGKLRITFKPFIVLFTKLEHIQPLPINPSVHACLSL